MGVIYVRPNLINGKKYVGQATNLEVRQRAWKNLNKSYAGPAINAARAKYGIDNFGFEILKECDDKELDYWEKYYIKELNTKAPYGYNLTDGGEGMNGYTHSAETRKKIGRANKGEKNYFYGKHLSEEHKRKISEANKGKKPSEETRKKLSKANKGEKNYFYGKHLSEEHKRKISEANKGKKRSEEEKLKLRLFHLGKPINQETKKKISKALKNRKRKPHSEETKNKISEKAKGRKVSEKVKKKISETLKGRKFSEETRKRMSEIQINGSHSKPVLQINKETNDIIKEWPSISEVERQIGINGSLIIKCCQNKPHHKSAGGYKWQYK